MDPEPLTVPRARDEPRRPAIPVLAALVPLAGGVVMWLITRSPFALCFAALGPLMIGASLVDGLRARRKERRRLRAETAEGWRRAEAELRRRHDAERVERRRRHPDVAACWAEPPLRDLRPVDETSTITLGAGTLPSTVRVAGGDLSAGDDRVAAFRERAQRIEDVPVAVPLGRGICVRGPRPTADAVVRALVVQLCLRHPPSQLALVGEPETFGLEGFPHARRPAHGARRVAVLRGDADGDEDVAVQIRACPAGGAVPEGITTVIDCTAPGRSRLRTTHGDGTIVAECLSRAQAQAIAAQSAGREKAVAVLPDGVRLADLPAGGRSGLHAVIGRGPEEPIGLDIVEDGPHAIVTGVTGSGKSELLVTWITAMAKAHGPEEVVFVLADFKGGSAFDALRCLPHVAAVMTDLDEEEARRGVESLTAELRRRERVLAEAGARDIRDPRARLPRLVIVVDEFAALVQEHPDLATVFTDLAARGRALGMHLIIGTQRAAGVIRDALAANAPLRISLRVTDAADSRLVIGSESAAEIPGGLDSRGLAFIRRPQDESPRPVRIALCDPADVRALAGPSPPRSPWLPPLPKRIPLVAVRGRQEEGSIVLGVADEPESQSQPLVTLRPGHDRGCFIVGGPGSGRTNAVRALVSQWPEALLLPEDPERAWDAVERLSEAEEGMPRLILCDDVDRRAAEFPPEYAQLFLERLEGFVRSAAARSSTIVVTASRLTGVLAKVADALPERILLRTSTVVEHLAAGGETEGFRRSRPPGRGRMGVREVQLLWAGEPDGQREEPVRAPAEIWALRTPLAGIVARTPSAVAPLLQGIAAVHTLTEQESAPLLHGSQGAPMILVGDAAAWQRHWSLLQRIRNEGELLVLAECQSELRVLTGERELPPFARPGAGRAWALRPGRPLRRVALPGHGRSRDGTGRRRRSADDGGDEGVPRAERTGH